MPKPKQQESRKIIAQNKKARHDYAVLENFEAGISLTGTEVKSCRANGLTLTDSYACVKEGELLLIGAHIAPYADGTIFNHDPKRARKLLMHKREIMRLKKSVEAKGLTLIALTVYFNARGKVKVELGLCRGKNVHDKRESLKEKADNLEIRRSLSRN